MKQREPLTNDDGEVRELTEEDFALARPITEALPPALAQMLLNHQAEMEAKGLMKPRGKQKAPTKQATTIRLSPIVLEKFKATGKGWQTRINEVLLEYALKM